MTLYLEHFGLAEAPFRITPATDMFFAGANRGEILAALLYAIEAGEGLVKVTGEVGSGKTMLSRMLIEKLPRTVDTVYIASPSLSSEEILHTLADELDIALPDGDRPGQVLRGLQTALIARYEAGRQVVVIIDEAHAMPVATLEEVRLLSNLEGGRHKLLQIVLFGQPELDEVLATQALRPLRERITHTLEVPPLDEKAVADYLEFRLRAVAYRGPNPFADKAITLLAKASLGLTRRVNILADKAMLAAFAENRYRIEKADVERAVRDCRLSDPLPKVGGHPARRFQWVLIGVALFAGMGGWLARDLSMGGLAKPTQNIVAPGPVVAPATSTPVDVAKTAVKAPAPAERRGAESSGEPVKAVEVTPEKEGEAPASAPSEPGYTLQLVYAESANTPGFKDFRKQVEAVFGVAAVQAVSTRIAGKSVFVLCAGQYASHEAARKAIGELPEPLRRFGPQVRSFTALKNAQD